MKKILLLILLVLVISAEAIEPAGPATRDTTTISLIKRTALFATVKKDNDFCKKTEIFIDKGEYKICFDKQAKGASLVWYDLDSKNINRNNYRKRPSFHIEPLFRYEPKYAKYKISAADYSHSGYDRGHMAPDMLFDYNKTVLYKVYSMANIVPQLPRVNRYSWHYAEKKAKKACEKYGRVRVFNIIRYKVPYKRLKPGSIAIPRDFFKIIFPIDEDEKINFNKVESYHVVNK